MAPVPPSGAHAGLRDGGEPRQWGAFLNRSGVAAPEDLDVVIQRLADFLGLVTMDAVASGERWAAGGPWGE